MVSFITRVRGIEKMQRSMMETMVGCVKALSVSMCALVGSMVVFQCGDHRDNGEGTPN
jgi:hypothetical protein